MSLNNIRIVLINTFHPGNIGAAGLTATEFWKTSGKELDTSTFMTAQEVAIMLKQALVKAELGYVSDISINRS